MKLRPSTLAAAALLALAVLALFLPWLRLQRPDPDAALRPLDVARQLVGDDDDNLLHNFLLLRRAEWQALLRDPFAGLSLIQALNASERGPGPGVITAGWVASFLGPQGTPLRLLWFSAPILALALVLLLLTRKPNPKALAVLAILAAGAYLGGRAWANHTWADRVLLVMDLGPGWWLSVYLLIPLAVLAAARAAAGPKAKW